MPPLGIAYVTPVGADAYIGPTLGTTCHAPVGHDDPGVPLARHSPHRIRRGRRPRRPEPPSIVKRTDSHVAPLLGMTENACHCEEARRADAAIRIPRPQRLPCVKGAVSRRLTEGLSEVDGPFGGALCRDPHPFLPPKKQSPAPALSCRGGAPFLLGSVLRANFLYWISMLVFLGRTFWAALGTDTCRMPFSKLAWMSSGITLSPT